MGTVLRGAPKTRPHKVDGISGNPIEATENEGSSISPHSESHRPTPTLRIPGAILRSKRPRPHGRITRKMKPLKRECLNFSISPEHDSVMRASLPRSV